MDRLSPRSRILDVPDIGREASDALLPLDRPALELTSPQRELFDALYREHFDFVFRNLRRLGVAGSAIDDALQDVYLVALRRIADFREGTHRKAWLFAIVLRVAGNYRRTQRRRGEPMMWVEERHETELAGPFDQAAQRQARALLHAFLDRLDENRRAAFVMAELEQMTAPEIGRVLSANVNTVYSWLRNLRNEFARMADAIRNEDGGGRG
jgi:RNA polymerase sigma-70 factor (ECF subfamily)